MRTVKVGKSHIAFVSDRDYNRVSAHTWYYVKNSAIDYAQTDIIHEGKRKRVYMHHIILGRVGANDGLVVDHKNHNGLDNRRINLRVCTQSDNMKNRRKARGSSKYNGVCRFGKQWIVHININRKCTHVGLFKCERQAALAFNKAARKTGNKFYRLNKVL